MAAGIRPNIDLATRRRPALRSRRAGRRHAADIRSVHLRRGRMRAAPQQHLRPGRAAVRAGATCARRIWRSSASAATRGSLRVDAAQGDAASTCSPPAISSAAQRSEALVLRDAKRGIYKRLVIEDNKVRGAVLYGDVKDGPWYFELMAAAVATSRALRDKLLFGADVARTMSEACARAPSEPPVPTAASAAACCAQTRTARLTARSRRSPAIREHPANFGRLCSKGSALGETLGLEGRLLHPHVRGERASWDERSIMSRRASDASSTAHGPRRGRVLRLRPAADGGLLRRQQADEGLHRHGQHRHQLAPVHVIGRRRPQARLRRRPGAGLLRGSRARRSRRARRLEHRVVPSDPVPAHRAAQAGAAAT